jgi:hypothetical protein
VHQAHAQKRCEAHLIVEGRNFAIALKAEEGKSKCAKFGIANTGFSNPKKRGGKILNSFVLMLL